MPGLFRKSAKPSTSAFGVAAALSIGLTIQFAVNIKQDIDAKRHHPDFLTLPLFWLIWNLLPLTIFAIGKLLQKKGK